MLFTVVPFELRESVVAAFAGSYQDTTESARAVAPEMISALQVVENPRMQVPPEQSVARHGSA
jgi:hypothetical protein